MTAWPPFTPAEEQAAFFRLNELWPAEERMVGSARSLAAQEVFDECILRNLHLVARVALRYNQEIGPANEFCDLLQEGTIGLMGAVASYVPARRVRFSIHAFYRIRAAIRRYLDNTANTIRIPVHAMYNYQRLREAMDKMPLDRQNGFSYDRSPGFAIKGGGSAHQLPIKRMSLADLARLEKTDHNLQSHECMECVRRTFEEIQRSELRPRMASVLSRLPSDRRYVIERRYGLDGFPEETLESLGVRLGVTRERIRQMEQEAMNLLRHPTRRRHLYEFFHHLEGKRIKRPRKTKTHAGRKTNLPAGHKHAKDHLLSESSEEARKRAQLRMQQRLAVGNNWSLLSPK